MVKLKIRKRVYKLGVKEYPQINYICYDSHGNINGTLHTIEIDNHYVLFSEILQDKEGNLRKSNYLWGASLIGVAKKKVEAEARLEKIAKSWLKCLKEDVH